MTNIINNYNYIIIQQLFHSGSCSYCTYLYKLYTENCKYFDQFASLSLSNNYNDSSTNSNSNNVFFLSYHSLNAEVVYLCIYDFILFSPLVKLTIFPSFHRCLCREPNQLCSA